METIREVTRVFKGDILLDDIELAVQARYSPADPAGTMKIDGIKWESASRIWHEITDWFDGNDTLRAQLIAVVTTEITERSPEEREIPKRFDPLAPGPFPADRLGWLAAGMDGAD